MEFKTKPLTLSQRIECNDIETEMNPSQGTVIVRDVFKQRIKYLRYGLKSLNGIEINEENFDAEVNKLANDEIVEIADFIAEETNLSKKK